MDRTMLTRLLAARAARVPVALISDLANGSQRLVEDRQAREDEFSAELDRAFRFDQSSVVKRDGGEFFIHVFNPPLKLILVGAVHIAQALLPMAQALGYDVTVIDPRGAFATQDRFAGVKMHPAWPDEALPEIGLDQRTAVALLTHDPKIDDPALHAALRSDCFYIGALGSKRTHAQRVERLVSQGFGEADLKRIHAPVGLEIGSRGAAEIAVSIMAQITQVLRLGSST